MNKGLRVLLHLFQVIFLLLAVLLLVESVTVERADVTFLFGSDVPREQWALIAGVLAIAFSPALWSLGRGGAAPAAAQPAGGFERVAPPAVPQQQPAQPGGVFEPMSADRMPAPPASSYGQPSQPSAGGYGGPPPGSPSPAQTDSPWGSGR
ncbi:hypothetical protein [Glycomyces paridis]|uniref:Uncharacterized protein n=1 Tax=Glycomyces paridis TaxID=2126555 RepID=A0A4S8PKF6_9ACTN|nr:hypothetical protein [Glycomyces paridis]THV31228.1 hypothetical protein E9998_02295 [Glycomyces paridis]